MEFRHAPPGVSRLGVSGLPHPRRGAITLSTCRMAGLRRLGPLPPFPRSLVKAPPRLPAGLPARTIVLLPTAMEDRLGVELWRTRPAIPKIPLIPHDKMPSLVVRYSQCAVSISLLASRAMSGPRPALRLVCASWRQHFCSVPPPGWLTVLLKSHFPRSNRPTFSLERCPLTRSRSVTSYSQAAKQNSTACEHMSRPTSGNTKGGEYSSSWHTPLRAFGSC